MVLRWLIFLLIFTIPYAVQAAELNVFRCSKYLAALAPLHQLPSMSAQFTEAAMSDLLRFRTNNLIDSPFQASNKAVTASDESSQRRKAKVAARVSGVLHDYRSPPQNTANDGEDRKSILAATSFVGKENILNELRKRQALVEEWKADPEIQASLKINNSLSYLYPIISFQFPAYMCFIFKSVIPAILFSVVLRDVLEIALRGLLNSYSLSTTTSEEAFFDAIERIHSPGLWHYSSFDIELSKHYLDYMWQPSPSFNGIIPLYFYKMLIYPKRTLQLPLSKYSLYSVLHGKQNPLQHLTWLRVDEVLHFDPVKKEPVLTIVLRMTKKLPRYPKRSPQKSKALTKLVPVLKPTD